MLLIQLVYQEDDGLLQLVGIAEGILGTYLRTILAIDENKSLIGNVEGSDGTTYEVV